MVNIYNFVKSLKVAWIRHNQQWFKLFGNHYGNTFVEYISKLGVNCISQKKELRISQMNSGLKYLNVGKSNANCKKQKQIQISFSHVFGMILIFPKNLCI